MYSSAPKKRNSRSHLYIANVEIRAKLHAHSSSKTYRISQVVGPNLRLKIARTVLAAIRTAKIVETELKYAGCHVEKSEWKNDVQSLVVRFDSFDDLGTFVDGMHEGAADGYLEGSESIVHIPDSKVSTTKFEIVFDNIKISVPDYW